MLASAGSPKGAGPTSPLGAEKATGGDSYPETSDLPEEYHPYLDMLKDVGLKSSSTVFIPHGPGAVSDVQGQMRQGFMEANAMSMNQSRAVMAHQHGD